MRRLSFLLTLSASATIVGSLMAFALQPAGFSTSSVTLIVAGGLTSTLVLVSGFLLVRAPWGRWGLALACGGGMLLASTNTAPVVYSLYALGALTIVGLAGPWVRFWVRQQPVSNALNPVAVSLSAVAPATPLVVGLAAFNASHWTHWLAAGVGVTGSFLYSRGAFGTLWVLRFGIPITCLLAYVNSPLPSAAIIVAGGILVTVLAWMPSAKQVTNLITPPLPAPRRATRKQTNANE